MNQEQAFNGILLSIKGIPLGSACESVKLYLKLFECLQINLDVDILADKIWHRYDPDREDEQMFETIKRWIDPT